MKPYNSWDLQRLQNYIQAQGKEVKKGTEKNKDSLLAQVQSYWHETGEQASDSYHNVQNFIFDTYVNRSPPNVPSATNTFTGGLSPNSRPSSTTMASRTRLLAPATRSSRLSAPTTSRPRTRLARPSITPVTGSTSLGPSRS